MKFLGGKLPDEKSADNSFFKKKEGKDEEE